MFSKDVLIEKKTVKNSKKQTTKKAKNTKLLIENKLMEEEHISFFAEIIVNKLLKNYSYES